MQERRLGFNLEPTFRCNLGCEMCPRFASEDPHLDMSMEVYQRIADAMRYAHNVDFTGWGEPLLHKRIYDMVAMAKERGCETSMTSNGTAINPRNAQRLIDAGMDRLTVSIDGLTPETYDTIRVGASLDKVAANLRGLSEQVAKSGSGLELAIAFTIQELNASQITDVPAWADSVGAKVVHLKQLNVPSTQEDWKLSLLKYRLGHNDAPANGHARGDAEPEPLPVLASGENEEPGTEAAARDASDDIQPTHALGDEKERSGAAEARSRTLWDRLTGRKDTDPLTQAEADIRKAVGKGKELGLKVAVHSELPIKPTLTPRHCLAAP
ncbi:MAG TPA: radical SAM protein, partial [Acidobacteriota bacterium]|nr:radical SAM protein [Acidobacteriota bacterium]